MEFVKMITAFIKMIAPYAALIMLIITLLGFLYKGIHFLLKKRQQRKLEKDLRPFFTDMDILRATQYYVPTRCQNIAPSLGSEPGSNHAFITKELLIPFFLETAFKTAKDDDKFYLILAGSGMGKTTAMINIYLQYVKQWRKKYKIELIPLGHHKALEAIKAIEDKKNTILLLDAFDEDYAAVLDYKKRLKELIDKVWEFQEVVLTCRTQFFPTEEAEPNEIHIPKSGGNKGYYAFKKLYISPFNTADIDLYLNQKFKWYWPKDWKKRKKAKQIVNNCPHLMVRPMLLSYIDDLLEEEDKRHEYTYEIYETLIDKWIQREANRQPKDKRTAFKQNLYEFSRKLAIDMYQQRAKHQRIELYIPANEIKDFAKKHDIDIEEDLELKSRSLLNRDAKGRYKFAHKSILEYFLALEAFENKEFEKEMNFDGMSGAARFYGELYISIGIENRENIVYANLSVTPITDISGLKKSPKLERLNIVHTEISNISILENLTQLRELYLFQTQITDISVLKNLPKLERLNLSQTQITDISVLKNLPKLERLNLSQTQISDISALKKLRNLIMLNLSQTQITDISVLKNLPKLENLGLFQTHIRDISVLKNLTQLRKLYLSQTRISDISVLKNLPKLELLDLTRTPISQQQIKELQKALPNCEMKYYLF